MRGQEQNLPSSEQNEVAQSLALELFEPLTKSPACGLKNKGAQMWEGWIEIRRKAQSFDASEYQDNQICTPRGA